MVGIYLPRLISATERGERVHIGISTNAYPLIKRTMVHGRWQIFAAKCEPSVRTGCPLRLFRPHHPDARFHFHAHPAAPTRVRWSRGTLHWDCKIKRNWIEVEREVQRFFDTGRAAALIAEIGQQAPIAHMVYWTEPVTEFGRIAKSP